METKMIEKLIKQAKAGRFGDNFVSIGEGAEEEFSALLKELSENGGLDEKEIQDD